MSIRVENLGKAYRRYPTEWHRFATWFGLPVRPSQERWVLRHVDFELTQGQAVGIVGQNGAGKSTLLKLITGTLRPSEGHVVIEGQIAALLELGMGFNPELTGRQNAQHAAGLMGHSGKNIHAAMPAIEEFAEIGEYFDKPVRMYSSGMQMRVAFAVATAFRPPLLIVDEALSVGDSYFQHKSFARIREFRDQGTTLLFVSHDRGAILSLCDRVILLDQGQVLKDGEPEEVMDFYNALIADRENQTILQKTGGAGKVQTQSGSGELTIDGIQLLNQTGNPIDTAQVGDAVSIEVVIHAHALIEDAVLGFMIKDRLGQPLFGTNSHHLEMPLPSLAPDQQIRAMFRFPMNLGAGHYSVAVALHKGPNHLEKNYEWRDLALTFQVTNTRYPPFVGSLWLPTRLEIES